MLATVGLLWTNQAQQCITDINWYYVLCIALMNCTVQGWFVSRRCCSPASLPTLQAHHQTQPLSNTNTYMQTDKRRQYQASSSRMRVMNHNCHEPPSATVVSDEPFSHGTETLRCLQKEMATYRHWSVSLWRDPDDVSHCRILSPDKTEWWLISATLCRWRRCFVADQLW